MHLGARGEKRLGARIAASQSEHLMARAHEFLNNGRTDKTCSTSDEDTHLELLLLLHFMTVTASAAPFFSR